MAYKMVYISNDNTQNYPFCRLQLVVVTFGTQLNEPTNKKIKKKIRPTIKKTLL